MVALERSVGPVLQNKQFYMTFIISEMLKAMIGKRE